MSARSYTRILEEEGVARQVGGDQPFLLGPDHVGYVRSGRLDIFAVRVADGEPVGRRTHLLRLVAGDPVIGIGVDTGSTLGMLAVGNPGTVIVQVQQAYLEALFARPSAWRSAAEFFHAWAEHLCRILANGRSPRNGNHLQPEETVALDAGACVRTGLPFGWVRQVRGSSHFLDRPGCELAEGHILPMTSAGWLQTADRAELRFLTTEQFLAGKRNAMEDGPWSAVGRLNRMALTITAQRLKEAAEAHRERSRLRQRATESAFSSALAHLAAPMLRAADRARARVRDEASGANESDLLAAFRIVADAAGIPANDVSRATLECASDRLAALTQALRLRSRRVALRDGWWKNDCGPLLARLTEPSRYVAVVPARRGAGYRMIDPVGAVEHTVDDAVAGTLEPFAYTFYQSFADSSLGLLTVLRFGMSGLREDLFTVVGVALLIGVIGTLTPIATGLLFGSVIPSADRGQLLQLTVILLLSGLVTAVFGVVRGLALLRMQIKAEIGRAHV